MPVEEESAIARVEGDAYTFPHQGEMAADNTALMIIDMQADFLAEGGYAHTLGADLPRMRAIIPHQQKILAEARRVGMLVIYTREGHRPGGDDITSVKRFRSRLGGLGVGDDSPLGKVLTRGEAGWQVIPELAPQPSEPTIDKVGSGSFYGTETEHLLRRRGVENLIFVGVTTECCVHTSLREASDRGFDNVLVEDACAATTAELQTAAIAIVRNPNTLFGTVTQTQRLLAGLAFLPSR
ncbi:MAG: isochorismatase family cysteine hydrolase [Pseudomonadota bacterium]